LRPNADAISFRYRKQHQHQRLSSNSTAGVIGNVSAFNHRANACALLIQLFDHLLPIVNYEQRKGIICQYDEVRTLRLAIGHSPNAAPAWPF
jgi:hypothetical protein